MHRAGTDDLRGQILLQLVGLFLAPRGPGVIPDVVSCPSASFQELYNILLINIVRFWQGGWQPSGPACGLAGAHSAGLTEELREARAQAQRGQEQHASTQQLRWSVENVML